MQCKTLLALLALVLLGVGAGACGSAGKEPGSASGVASHATSVGGTPASAASGAAPATGQLKGDEDDDDAVASFIARGARDGDGDTDSDRRDKPNKGYYDSDDAPIRSYGHAASAADRRAIVALVERYRAAQLAGDGARACALTYFILAESIPEDYGQPPGPFYLHGAGTCAAVLTRVFRHFHSQLAAPVRVTGVRVEGDRADALVGSPTLPAGFMELRRERGAWKIDRILAAPLP